MTKQEFFNALNKGLSGLVREELDERLEFYSEMIDDRIEDGLSEEEAVKELGSPDEVIAKILCEIPLSKIVKKKIKSTKKPETWAILLIVLGFPVWLPLLAALFAVTLATYAVIWSLIISAWSVFVSFAACSLAFLTTGIIMLIIGNVTQGLALTGASLILAGLSLFAFYGCKKATVGCVILTKKIILLIKKCFIGKERAI